MIGCSCMFGKTAMQDNRQECNDWAAAGECTENPVFIHLNCPISCNQAIGWSPWAREHADVEVIIALFVTEVYFFINIEN